MLRPRAWRTRPWGAVYHARRVRRLTSHHVSPDALTPGHGRAYAFAMIRGALTALAVVCASRLAAADPNDLVLSRLGTRIMDGKGQLTGVGGENLGFRELASQLGVVLAPHLLTPADTLGFGGFQFDVTASQTTIDSK